MENKNILFSIITVSFNSAKTIEKTILSILNQDFKLENIEYIIIDGGSTDETINIIKKYEGKFPNYIWISEKDKGIYDAMNKGIQKANGEIIGIVNSDDWLEGNALSILHEKSSEFNNKKNIYVGSLYFHYLDGSKQFLPMTEIYFSQKKKKYIMPVRHPATFVHKDIYKEIGNFDINFKIEADCDFIYRCIENNINFCFIDQPLSNMLDGGVSNNSKYIKSCLKDRHLFFIKRNLSIIKQSYYILSYSIRIFLKVLLGTPLIKIYRNIN